MASKTKMPTRSWLRLTFLFDRGMVQMQARLSIRYSRPAPFLMSPQKLLNVWIRAAFKAFIRAAEDDFALPHHHYFAVD